MRIYTVALHEVPRPAERAEVSLYAAGPADALVKGGQMFTGPRAPFAWLEIIGVAPAGPMHPAWSELERVELVDE